MTVEDNKSCSERDTSDLQPDLMGEEAKRLRHFDQKVSAADLLKPENWPAPKWYSEKKTAKVTTYEQYFALELRTRYLELETDFRSLLGNFPDATHVETACRIVDLLRSAREALEQGTLNLLTISSSLDLVERCMVWLYPPWLAKARLESTLFRLERHSFKGKDFLKQKLEGLSKLEKETYPGQFPSVLDEALGLMGEEAVQIRIGRGLHINRLRDLRFWGVVVLLIFFLATPLAANLNHMAGWPSDLIVGQRTQVYGWMNALAMMVVGAVGAFLSGLLQARSTQETLSEYLESGLKLQLRPLIGALVSLILYVILSWQVLPAIAVVNAGSYFLIAFLSGFSERYFLSLLKTKTENSTEEAKASGNAQGSGFNKGQPEEQK